MDLFWWILLLIILCIFGVIAIALITFISIVIICYAIYKSIVFIFEKEEG